jgi:hypothetical protein
VWPLFAGKSYQRALFQWRDRSHQPASFCSPLCLCFSFALLILPLAVSICLSSYIECVGLGTHNYGAGNRVLGSAWNWSSLGAEGAALSRLWTRTTSLTLNFHQVHQQL